ncbi:MAG TPA: alpha/beta hydrolase [Flavobacteriales bacterium]|nr:alpha/beta hydrolase [Flavobacteriales bacterium]
MKITFCSAILLAASMAIFASCGEGQGAEETKTDSTTIAQNTDTGSTQQDTIKIHGSIEFTAADGLVITADSYEILPGEKYILLCHQAGYSRGEYVETAKKLNEMGYNCLAIDQRSGEACNGVVNETARRAKEQKKKTGYLDAGQDIVAAIDYIYNHSQHPVVVVGSSYSAALALKIAKNNNKVSAVAVFSPGEYLKGINLQKEISGLNIPVFATSSKEEANDVATLLSGIADDKKTLFAPSGAGDHGSQVLWESAPDHNEYWTAFSDFLDKVSTPQ